MLDVVHYNVDLVHITADHDLLQSHRYVPHSGFRKTHCLKKAQLGFGLYWVFRIFLSEWAVGKLVGWLSSSAYLLFKFATAFGHLKISKIITYWLMEAVNTKKYLIILAWQTEIELNLVLVFCRDFSTGFTQKNPVGITRLSESCPH